MRRILCALLVFVAVPAFADSFVYASGGQTITNGEAVNVKTLRARFGRSMFWFKLDDKVYIVRDRNVLARMKKIYEPLFSPGAEARLDDINHNIERQLHDLGRQLIAQRIAVQLN